MPAPPAPGWYPDPSSPQQERWWDGAAWSDETREATGGAWARPAAPDEPAGEPARPRWATPPAPDATTLPAGAARAPGRRRGLVAVAAVVGLAVIAVAGVLAVRGLGDDDPSADPGGGTSSQSEESPPSPTSSSLLASCVSNNALEDAPHAGERGVIYGGGLALPLPPGLEDVGDGFDLGYAFGTDIAGAGEPAGGDEYATTVVLMGVPRLENSDPRQTAIAVAECATSSLGYFPPRNYDATVSDLARETTVAGAETWTTRAAVIADGDVGLNQADQVQTLVVDTGSSDQWGVAIVITANSGGDSDDVRRGIVDALVLE